MRSFQQIVVLLFAALFAFAFAQEDAASYDATVYVTSTVYRVNTVTMSGTPTGTVSVETSTISAYIPEGTGYAPSHSGNGTSVAPTGAYPTTTPPPFEGAASSMGVNGVVAILAAGMAYLAL